MSVHDEIDEFLEDIKSEIRERLDSLDIGALVNKIAADKIESVILEREEYVEKALSKMSMNIIALQDIWASDENKATYTMIKRLDLMNMRMAKVEECQTFFMSMIDNRIGNEKK
jgi:hypothetical protein